MKKVRQCAVAHLRDVSLWPIDEFRDWAWQVLSFEICERRLLNQET